LITTQNFLSFFVFFFFLLLMPGWTFHSVNSVDEIEAFQFQFWG